MKWVTLAGAVLGALIWMLKALSGDADPSSSGFFGGAAKKVEQALKAAYWTGFATGSGATSAILLGIAFVVQLVKPRGAAVVFASLLLCLPLAAEEKPSSEQVVKHGCVCGPGCKCDTCECCFALADKGVIIEGRGKCVCGPDCQCDPCECYTTETGQRCPGPNCPRKPKPDTKPDRKPAPKVDSTPTDEFWPVWKWAVAGGLVLVVVAMLCYWWHGVIERVIDE